ncbi:helix-turn-helix transcriptional regulator [Caenispirillum bisanense]|uniref:helix-turn-helix domain-containing protein n=1 Tax=Caenispirillum bisanense TaxID=414052 RepID=UPI0031D5AD17
MTPKAFKLWRKSLNLSQKDAAAALGLKHRIVQYYEKGERDGKPIRIPRSVRLACWALSQGVVDFDGSTAEARALADISDTPAPPAAPRRTAGAAEAEAAAADA